MSLARGNLRIGDSLDPFEQSSSLSHRGDQMRSYIRSDVLIFWIIGRSIKVCHGDGHISAWCLVDLLISDHVKSITEVVWDELPLLICSPLSCSRCCLCSSVSPSTTGSSLLTLKTRSPRRGGKTGKREKPGGYGGRSKSSLRPQGLRPR